MIDSRGRGRNPAQKRKLLMDTIGRHAFGTREIERRLRTEVAENRTRRQESLPAGAGPQPA